MLCVTSSCHASLVAEIKAVSRGINDVCHSQETSHHYYNWNYFKPPLLRRGVISSCPCKSWQNLFRMTASCLLWPGSLRWPRCFLCSLIGFAVVWSFVACQLKQGKLSWKHWLQVCYRLHLSCSHLPRLSLLVDLLRLRGRCLLLLCLLGPRPRDNTSNPAWEKIFTNHVKIFERYSSSYLW